MRYFVGCASFFLVIGFVFEARADRVISTMRLYAQCELNGVYYDISVPEESYPLPSLNLQPLDAVVIRATGVDSVDSLPARIEVGVDGDFEITGPAYWDMPVLRKQNCVPLLDVNLFSTAIVKLRVSGYWISASIPWEDATRRLPELVESCDAIPIIYNVLCDRRRGASGPLGCASTQILDDIIPVETDCL